MRIFRNKGRCDLARISPAPVEFRMDKASLPAPIYYKYTTKTAQEAIARSQELLCRSENPRLSIGARAPRMGAAATLRKTPSREDCQLSNERLVRNRVGNESSDRVVKLRDDPRMIHRSGYNNWPPVWTTTRKGDTRPHGEVGILNHALMHESFNNRLFVRMTYEGRRYMGLLAFSDAAFCRQVHSVLQSYLRRHMSEIGEIELAHI